MRSLWRYDNELDTIEKVSVREEAPTEKWIPVIFGSGYYVYSESLTRIKEIAKEGVQDKINALNKTMEYIENLQEI